MLNYNQYSAFTPFCACATFSNLMTATTNPIGSVIGYITFRKIPENPVVTPGSAAQVITASAVNRYLESVTVKAVTTPTP
jgi:hypothetical protein